MFVRSVPREEDSCPSSASIGVTRTTRTLPLLLVIGRRSAHWTQTSARSCMERFEGGLKFSAAAIRASLPLAMDSDDCGGTTSSAYAAARRSSRVRLKVGFSSSLAPSICDKYSAVPSRTEIVLESSPSRSCGRRLFHLGSLESPNLTLSSGVIRVIMLSFASSPREVIQSARALAQLSVSWLSHTTKIPEPLLTADRTRSMSSQPFLVLVSPDAGFCCRCGCFGACLPGRIDENNPPRPPPPLLCFFPIPVVVASKKTSVSFSSHSFGFRYDMGVSKSSRSTDPSQVAIPNWFQSIFSRSLSCFCGLAIVEISLGRSWLTSLLPWTTAVAGPHKPEP
mmetsp:Transcript_4281/g.8908  ORF Transcript_4281/g.8908 Transcript_4281/m.8908 type:complete len:338 (-) Transcript_4281:256-1269(-)